MTPHDVQQARIAFLEQHIEEQNRLIRALKDAYEARGEVLTELMRRRGPERAA